MAAHDEAATEGEAHVDVQVEVVLHVSPAVARVGVVEPGAVGHAPVPSPVEGSPALTAEAARRSPTAETTVPAYLVRRLEAMSLVVQAQGATTVQTASPTADVGTPAAIPPAVVLPGGTPIRPSGSEALSDAPGLVIIHGAAMAALTVLLVPSRLPHPRIVPLVLAGPVPLTSTGATALQVDLGEGPDTTRLPSFMDETTETVPLPEGLKNGPIGPEAIGAVGHLEVAAVAGTQVATGDAALVTPAMGATRVHEGLPGPSATLDAGVAVATRALPVASRGSALAAAVEAFRLEGDRSPAVQVRSGPSPTPHLLPAVVAAAILHWWWTKFVGGAPGARG